MANLRGNSSEKQIKDAFHRLVAFGQGRRDTDLKGQTHSLGTADKRLTELKAFGDYMHTIDFTGKLNTMMHPQMMEQFFASRLEGLQSSSKESVLRTWSSMTEGLKEKNISIDLDQSYFDGKVQQLRDQGPIREAKTKQAVQNLDRVLNELYDKRMESGIYAEIMAQTGLRSREAYELMRHSERYCVALNNGYVVRGLKGKGNHRYADKPISVELLRNIQNIQKLPSLSTLTRDFKVMGLNAHRFRYSYARNRVEALYTQGVEHHTVLKSVSQELNHKREEMTQYYIKRA
ncbi:MAG: hypothetical protein JXK05_09725 [Campylobacterales bacterium]|nr:hypothetical protein [Campylobacterales bacterium]